MGFEAESLPPLPVGSALPLLTESILFESIGALVPLPPNFALVSCVPPSVALLLSPVHAAIEPVNRNIAVMYLKAFIFVCIS
jgi:hypothetical protein